MCVSPPRSSDVRCTDSIPDNQGMFGQILTMYTFKARLRPFYGGVPDVAQGLLTAILELGAWVGVLFNGWLADAVGRRQSKSGPGVHRSDGRRLPGSGLETSDIQHARLLLQQHTKTFGAGVTIGCVVFTIGVIVQACTPFQGKDYILAGRFVTGLGVGAYSMLVPLYNAELAPPETRGALVALQQLAITFGIMISYWIGYGTNYIGGVHAGQSDAAWLIPICIQLVPSTTLAAGMLLFMPQSPRHLMNRGREQECLETLARLRSSTTDDIKVRIEFLEIKALRDFERLRAAEKYPNLQDGSFSSNFKMGINEYMSLLTNPSLRKRTLVAVFTMVFQQWNGVSRHPPDMVSTHADT